MTSSSTFLLPEVAALVDSTASEHTLLSLDPQALASMLFTLGWRSSIAQHHDSTFVPKVNFWRDILPTELENGYRGMRVGERIDCALEPGEVLPAYDEHECRIIPSRQFQTQRDMVLVPRSGRFYPRSFIAGVGDIYKGDMRPFRVAENRGEQLFVDLNHPLVGPPLTLTAEVMGIRRAGDEHGGMCQDVVELSSQGGPGIQTRWRGMPTDFWSDEPFARLLDEDDEAFYRQSRLVEHVDATASGHLQRLYQRLVPPQSRILDLMGSWKSHLDLVEAPQQVCGLGMNREELERNRQYTDLLVHDLNSVPCLPYDKDSFDAVVCSLSVEYLIRPQEVFAEVARVLRPGGRFVLSFSNRWFAPKVIAIWSELHPFERLGLVLEYFALSGQFSDLGTYTIRGLPRPLQDKYAGQYAESDPLFAVWGDAV